MRVDHHKIIKCKICEKIIMQCRCPKHKDIEFSVCSDCKVKNNNSGEKND